MLARVGTKLFPDRRSVLLGAAALAGCASAAPQPASADPEADADFRTFVDRLAQRSRASRPFLLRRYDASRLTPDGRILYEAIAQGLDADAALSRRQWGADSLPYAVSHRYGAYRRAAEMREDDDLRIILREINRDTNRLEGDAERGVIAPDFVLDATMPAVEGAARRLAETGGEEREAITAAVQRQLGVLRELRTRATSEAGVWRLPDGEAFYADTLQFQLGARVSPREAHETAFRRARELQAEADVLLRGYGLSQGDVASRLRALAADPRHLAADDGAKARAVDEMNVRLARVRALLADVITDGGTAPGTVQRLDPAIEANGAQGRRQGGRYLVDLGAPRPTWTLPSVVHHEVCPGHILQAQYERGLAVPNLQARYAGGYSEGWATYAEQLADDIGAFSNDPLGRIGHLQWMLFRLARVIADTGIHVMRWSRERAVEEMRALQGDSIAFVSIEDDVVRFCAQPGTFAAQGLAALHIADLRERMRREARQSFSMPAFHDAMLRHGPLSPPGLEQAARAAFALG
jgi:uncharacterized protein (DUF885 family)